MPRGITKTAADKRTSGRDFKGAYSLRFAGFGLAAEGYQFYVAGVGQFQLNGAGVLSGSQYSSICRMSNVATISPPFLYETFELSGTYAIADDGTGTVSIDFVQQGQVVEQDVFRVVPGDAAMTRFWLISTHPTVQAALVPELVTGEAVRLN
jgi:hypothetical protein